MQPGEGPEHLYTRWHATPWEVLRQLPDVASHLKAELTIAQMEHARAT